MPSVFLAHTPQNRANYYGAEALRQLQALGDVTLHEGALPLDAAQLIRAAHDADIIVADRMTAGPSVVFASLPTLQAFVRVAVDIRTIDVAAASAAGVLVTRAGPGFVSSVVELIVGMMIDLSRSVSASVLSFRQNQHPAIQMGRQLAGSTMGVIGYGSIGRRLADIGLALGMRVLVSDPYATVTMPGLIQCALPLLLAKADYTICLATMLPETENLMNAEAFANMPKGAFFINGSRGELVDEEALFAALESGHLGGAGLDVGRAPDQMPSPRLAALPNVIATPHIGGLTPPAIAAQALETVLQVKDILAGTVPTGAVNAESWRRRR